MFEGFEQVKDDAARKRWFASTGTSVIVVLVIGAGLVLLARQQVAKAHVEKEIDVTFQAAAEPEMEKKPPPPPPPPPPSVKRTKRPGRAAPATVTEIPDDRPTEADPALATTTHEAYDEFGDGEETKAPPAPPLPPPPPPPPPVEDVKVPDPIQEVDTAFVQARALSSNLPPAYPESSRKKGAEAVVKLKVRISATGEVTEVTLLSGEEPFAAAAIAAVKSWRYAPATDEGKPVASTRIVSIPFRLQSR